MVESVLTAAETPYPVAPGEIDTSVDANRFQKGFESIPAGIAARLFFESSRTEDSWRPLNHNEIAAPLGSLRLTGDPIRKGLATLVQQGYLTLCPGGYYEPSVEFVLKGLEITQPPIDSHTP